ncbi:methyltransferase domain-containing protein [Ahrensia kielensis]|uniref:Methyltransferase domain-containing protein n=1 Tax=Ahrensia kielensis TaxID=76980 RepID=A0ABU9T7Y3_9HYPH
MNNIRQEPILRRVARRMKGVLTGGASYRQKVISLKEQNEKLKSKLEASRASYRDLKQQYGGVVRGNQLTQSPTEKERYESNLKILTTQIAILKTKLDVARQQFRNARVDQRSITPTKHNTEESMNVFFANNEAEEPYLDFSVALNALLNEHDISLDHKDVLDVGVGPAVMLEALLEDFDVKSVNGLDFSSVAIEKAKQRLPHGKFEVASIYDAISARGDVVICTEVLEHLENPEKALKNILDAVKPGGVAVLTVPDGRVDYSLYHINFWSPESWRIFVNNAAGNAGVDIGQFRIRETSSYANNFAIVRKPT